MHITLMHNPTAGDEQHSQEMLLETLREAGYEPYYQSTDENNFSHALESPGEFVVVAGGDGTVNKVIKHLIGCDIPIAILPLGTANNIAKTFGIVGSLKALIAGWASARRRKFDIGVAEGPWGVAHFIEAIGVGLFPQMMPFISAIKKGQTFSSPDEELEYDLDTLKALLSDYRSQAWQVTLDGQVFSGHYLLLEAMNIQDIGPNICLAPEADPSDGYLDVVFVTEEERDNLRQYLSDCLVRNKTAPNFTVRRGQHLQLQWKGSEVHVDSDVWADEDTPFQKVDTLKQAAPATIEVYLKRHALEFLVPS